MMKITKTYLLLQVLHHKQSCHCRASHYTHNLQITENIRKVSRPPSSRFLYFQEVKIWTREFGYMYKKQLTQSGELFFEQWLSVDLNITISAIRAYSYKNRTESLNGITHFFRCQFINLHMGRYGRITNCAAPVAQQKIVLIRLTLKTTHMWKFYLKDLTQPNYNVQIAIYRAATDPVVNSSNIQIYLIRNGIVAAHPNRI